MIINDLELKPQLNLLVLKCILSLPLRCDDHCSILYICILFVRLISIDGDDRCYSYKLVSLVNVCYYCYVRFDAIAQQ